MTVLKPFDDYLTNLGLAEEPRGPKGSTEAKRANLCLISHNAQDVKCVCKALGLSPLPLAWGWRRTVMMQALRSAAGRQQGCPLWGKNTVMTFTFLELLQHPLWFFFTPRTVMEQAWILSVSCCVSLEKHTRNRNILLCRLFPLLNNNSNK